MAIETSEIAIGAYYLTDTDQLRRVDAITKDSKKRRRIGYSAKSAKLKNRRFAAVGTKANPALETTFARACSKRLTPAQVDTLRKDQILLKDE